MTLCASERGNGFENFQFCWTREFAAGFVAHRDEVAILFIPQFVRRTCRQIPPVEQKKGADHGIDGKILFRDDLTAAKSEQIIIQVKGGKTGVKDVRDLRGVLDREKAAIGILISVQPPTREMQAEAASAGFYEHKVNKLKYPRIQLRTVKELMTGKGIERPVNLALDETFKKAPTSRRKSAEDQVLPGM